jgi:hypothetical protein
MGTLENRHRLSSLCKNRPILTSLPCGFLVRTTRLSYELNRRLPSHQVSPARKLGIPRSVFEPIAGSLHFRFMPRQTEPCLFNCPFHGILQLLIVTAITQGDRVQFNMAKSFELVAI